MKGYQITQIGQILEAIMIVASLYILLQGLIYLIVIGSIVLMIMSNKAQS